MGKTSKNQAQKVARKLSKGKAKVSQNTSKKDKGTKGKGTAKKITKLTADQNKALDAALSGGTLDGLRHFLQSEVGGHIPSALKEKWSGDGDAIFQYALDELLKKYAAELAKISKDIKVNATKQALDLLEMASKVKVAIETGKLSGEFDLIFSELIAKYKSYSRSKEEVKSYKGRIANAEGVEKETLEKEFADARELIAEFAEDFKAFTNGPLLKVLVDATTKQVAKEVAGFFDKWMKTVTIVKADDFVFTLGQLIELLKTNEELQDHVGATWQECKEPLKVEWNHSTKPCDKCGSCQENKTTRVKLKELSKLPQGNYPKILSIVSKGPLCKKIGSSCEHADDESCDSCRKHTHKQVCYDCAQVAVAPASDYLSGMVAKTIEKAKEGRVKGQVSRIGSILATFLKLAPFFGSSDLETVLTLIANKINELGVKDEHFATVAKNKKEKKGGSTPDDEKAQMEYAKSLIDWFGTFGEHPKSIGEVETSLRDLHKEFDDLVAKLAKLLSPAELDGVRLLVAYLETNGDLQEKIDSLCKQQGIVAFAMNSSKEVEYSNKEGAVMFPEPETDKEAEERKARAELAKARIAAIKEALGIVEFVLKVDGEWVKEFDRLYKLHKEKKEGVPEDFAALFGAIGKWRDDAHHELEELHKELRKRRMVPQCDLEFIKSTAAKVDKLATEENLDVAAIRALFSNSRLGNLLGGPFNAREHNNKVHEREHNNKVHETGAGKEQTMLEMIEQFFGDASDASDEDKREKLKEVAKLFRTTVAKWPSRINGVCQLDLDLDNPVNKAKLGLLAAMGSHTNVKDVLDAVEALRESSAEGEQGETGRVYEGAVPVETPPTTLEKGKQEA